MHHNDKAAQRSTLILQLGKVLAPVDEIATRSPPPRLVEYQIVAASLSADLDQWMNEVSEFVQFQRTRFHFEYNAISHEVHTLCHWIGTNGRGSMDPAQLQISMKDCLTETKKRTLAEINKVPIEWAARIHEALTPYTVYLRIRDAIDAAKSRIHYFDRYLDFDFFDLYLRNVNRQVEVRLVTTKGKSTYGASCVLPVSRKAAVEFSDYKLIECQPADLHDRNLRIDDHIFFLGTSTKDAGTQPMNFSPSDCTPSGHGVLDGIIATGIEVT